MKYASRKFAMSIIALIGSFALAGYGVYKGDDYTGIAAIIGAIAGIAGQYSLSNAMSKGRGEE